MVSFRLAIKIFATVPDPEHIVRSCARPVLGRAIGVRRGQPRHGAARGGDGATDGSLASTGTQTPGRETSAARSTPMRRTRLESNRSRVATPISAGRGHP